jgi:hypothetical protein
VVSSEPTGRVIQIDAELQRGMVFDTTVYIATRPIALIAYTALSAALVINIIVLSITASAGQEISATSMCTVPAIAALIIATLLFSRASTRRAITTAMPSGSSVRVTVGDAKIQIIAKQGVSEIPYATFNGFKVGRHAALLRVRGTSVVTAIPRALLTDDDIALLRAKIG